jgi:glucose-1-phosphate cytidylyltransferase
MKVLILAGGYGTRLAEYTDAIPKPMVPVGGHPILWHIMKAYSAYGHTEFFVALGYKGEVIKDYFLNYYSLNSDLTVDLGTGSITHHNSDTDDWRITLVDTGISAMTGARVKRMQSYLETETFFLTYGDGLSDLDLNSLLRFHRSHGKLVTVTAVHPGARFGELYLNEQMVVDFAEKPQVRQGWINGGFFVIEPGFFDYIDSDDSSILEKAPLERAAHDGQLMAYRHEGFWHCMDTKRDHDALEQLWKSGSPPWRS